MIRDHAKGFTLIEIVFTLAILGVVAGFVGTPLISMTIARATINERVTQDADAVFALEKISNEIRFGGAIPSECSAGDEDGKDTTSSTTYNLRSDEEVFVDGSGSTILTDVTEFTCEEFSEIPGLYELTLKLKTQTYTSRAYRRSWL